MIDPGPPFGGPSLRMLPPRMENQMEKKMEKEIETPGV